MKKLIAFSLFVVLMGGLMLVGPSAMARKAYHVHPRRHAYIVFHLGDTGETWCSSAAPRRTPAAPGSFTGSHAPKWGVA